jgi:hypothetical protein
VIAREWKAGDRIELELPLKVQRVSADERIAATRGKTALRLGPLIYNIERVDQDISRPLAANSALTSEWRADLLGGLTVIRGAFADGSPMLAIPNYARTNRDQDLPPEAGPLAADPAFYMGPTAQQPGQQQGRDGAPRPVASLIWMARG